jgi:hypothetical protein
MGWVIVAPNFQHYVSGAVFGEIHGRKIQVPAFENLQAKVNIFLDLHYL